MQDQLRSLLDAGVVPSTSLAPTSRYTTTEIRTWTPAATGAGDRGEPVPYRSRRLCPSPQRHALLREHITEAGDRGDLLAAQQLGDAALWWRIADANAELDPSRLALPVGRRLRITSASDVPGAPDAV